MIKKGRICTKEYLVDPAHIIPNVIPRPLPRFSLTAMENSLHGCEVLSGWRSGKKGTSFQRMLLLACNYTCINAEAPQPPGNDMTTSRQSAFMFSYVILPDICGQLPSGKDRPSHTPAPTETAKSLGISGLISRNVREVITCGEGHQYLRCIYCLSKVEKVTQIYWHMLTLLSHPCPPAPEGHKIRFKSIHIWCISLSTDSCSCYENSCEGSSAGFITYKDTILQFSSHAFPTIVRSH